MVDEQALRIESSAARLTARELLRAMEMAVRALAGSRYKTHTGQQTIELLNRQGRALSSVEVDKNTLNDIKRQMKAYAVDFAVTTDKETGKLELWFKGQDVERVQSALEGCIANMANRDNAHESSIQRICEQAREQAEVLNAQRVAAPPERGERL